MSATRRDVDTGDGARDVLVSSSEDPTRTQTAEARYAQRLRGGYQRINALVREYVGRRNYLGLGEQSVTASATPPTTREAELTAATPPPNVALSRDDQKIERFRQWLQQAQDDEVLTAVGPNENRYVMQAYETGLRSTNADIRRAGAGSPPAQVSASMQVPVHRDTLQVLYTRNFNELVGLTDEMGRDVARTLTQALAEGTGPREAASRIVDVIGTIEDGVPHGAQARATTIARTEILRARHLAAQRQYERFGVELVEPLLSPTACPECVAIAADAPYRVGEISGIWPVHPSCRCSVTTYTGSEATASARRVSASAARHTHHHHSHT